MFRARHGLVAALILPLVAIVIELAAGASARADDKPQPIAIKLPERKEPVSFAKEVLPILSKNCLACHNAAKSENSLVLETPQTMAKGGDSGPAIVPGKSADSLMLKVAAHQEEPLMPPDDNNVEAKDLTPEELGLLAAWIDQGAISDASATAAPVKWQTLPSAVQPIYAVAASPDGQYAACTRGNQIFLYHLPTGQFATRLVDPELTKSGLYSEPGVAHFDLAQSLAFSPDGDRLASGSYREVKLWQRVRNGSLARIALPQDASGSLALSADRKSAAIGDNQGTITLWDLTTGQPIKTLSGHTGPVTALQFRDAEVLVSGSADQSIRLWKLADGSPLGVIATPAAVAALALVQDGARIVSGGADKIVRIWKAEGDPAAPTGWTNSANLEGHQNPITALVSWSSQDKKSNVIFSGSADGSIRQWTLDPANLDAGSATREIAAGGPVAALAIRPDGLQLASVGGSNLLKLWKTEDGQPWTDAAKQPLPEIKGDLRAALRAAGRRRMVDLLVAQLADAKKAVADGEAKIAAAAETTKTTAAARETAQKALAEKMEGAKKATAAKEVADKLLASLAGLVKPAQDAIVPFQQALEKDSASAELKQLLEAAQKLAADTEERRKGAEAAAKAAADALTKAQQEATAAETASRGAERLASAAEATHAKAVAAIPALQAAAAAIEGRQADANAKATEAAGQAAALEKPFRSVTYSPDGSQLAVGGDNQIVYTFSSDRGRPLQSYEGHAGPVFALALLSTGSPVSIGTDKLAVVWQALPTWQLERRIGNVDDPTLIVDRVLALAFDPSGTVLATGGGEPSRSGELKLWNVADGQPLRTITPSHSDTIFGIEFSPDGLLLASGAADRIVKVFDVASGALANSFEGHTHHVLDVAWRGDGKMLASAGADAVIKFWDYASGDQVRATQPPLDKEATSIAFIGLSNQLISSWGDRSVRLCDADDAKFKRDFKGATDFLYAAAVTPDGKTVIAGGQDSTLFEWNLEDGKVVHKYDPPAPPPTKVAGQ
jgi:WD40 repeat protein